ncbi:MAG: GH92 family glycosyl hydrolase [Bacteroidales bacterium]|nr:GH92 family glycosyl hydrolase [Bacteroidales bacterium]
MKKYSFILVTAAALLAAACGCSDNQPVDNVDPFIGSGFHGHVFVGANVPFGFVQAGPTNISQGWDWCSGYHDSDSTVIGFSHTHLSGTGCGDLLDITLMPVVGKDLTYARGKKDEPGSGLWSYADRSAEIAEPGYYNVPLTRYGIKAEMTATERCAIHRFTFPASEEAAFVFDLRHGGNWDHTTDSFAEAVGDNAIRGWRFSKGWAKNQRIYFYAEFSKPVEVEYIASEDDYGKVQEQLYTRVNFVTTEGEQVLAKVGISAVSMEGAEMNLRSEIRGWDFDKVHAAARTAWNKALSKIKIDAPEETKTIFYTALYHAMIAPSLFNDVDGSYRGSDDQVYEKADFDNYTTFSLWDTYRAEMPLLCIIEPARMDDMVETMLKIGEQQGFLPIWHLMANETYCMPGESGVIAVADAIVKGFKGFDREAAYEALKSSLDTVGCGNEYRIKYGYVPSDLCGTSLGKDMEFAIADAAVANAARALGKDEEAIFFDLRSHSYRNYMDPETGFARARMLDGSWRTPFNPFGHINTDYTEGNAWQYTWLAPHDVDWLVEFAGGKEGFEAKLDSLFTVSEELEDGAAPDMSGMIGQYVHGNEPSHHIIYLYAMQGLPWKTADRAREVMTTLYTTDRAGLCGNEDVGQMSAWYILSALGFYQVEPACTQFWFGSPVVDKAVINAGGKKFTVIAKNNSPENKYIQSITLNGKPYDLPFIDYKDIMSGGKLVLEMGSEPVLWY